MLGFIFALCAWLLIDVYQYLILNGNCPGRVISRTVREALVHPAF